MKKTEKSVTPTQSEDNSLLVGVQHRERTAPNFIKKIKKFLNFNKNAHNFENTHCDIPTHIAIIMDGNGRWARKRKLPRSAGHKMGANTLQNIVEYCNGLGIKFLTVYAFSTENWKRPPEEVNYLMDLLMHYLKNAEKKLKNENIRIRIIGDKSALSPDIVRQIDYTERITKKNAGLTLIIALNYGGRAEIVQAIKKITKDINNKKLNINDINEQLIGNYLYTQGFPDPDLIIRPSGELRLSNFLLWQSAYSELWFSNVHWPDFTSKNLLQAISDYQKRNRRFGGI